MLEFARVLHRNFLETVTALIGNILSVFLRSGAYPRRSNTMAKRVMKRERTNHAAEFDTVEAIQAAKTIEEAMQEFLLAKQAERAADRTIRDYKAHFRYFRTWLDMHHPNVKLSQITTKIIHEYISYMSNEKMKYDDHPIHSALAKPGVVGLSPMTVNVRIRTLRAFFNPKMGYSP
jgi:integrase/recombinase XerD